MRNNVVRWAGISGVAFAAVLVFQMMAYRISGVDVYSEHYASTLEQIVDNRMSFTLSAGAGAIAAVFMFPLILGLFYSFDEDDRPAAMLAAMFLALSTVLIVVAMAFYGNLVGTAVDYSRDFAQRSVISHQGDVLADQFEIIQYAGLVAFGVGLVILGRLMLGSVFYNRPLGWLSMAVGLSTVLFNVLPTIVIVGRLLWLIATGWTMWARASEEVEAEPEAVRV
jgi:hypothetical protein